MWLLYLVDIKFIHTNKQANTHNQLNPNYILSIKLRYIKPYNYNSNFKYTTMTQFVISLGLRSQPDKNLKTKQNS